MESQSCVAVVMVPFPAQGHLNPLLHLCRLISALKVSVHYVGSMTHIHQARSRVQGWDPSMFANLHFHGFPTPPNASNSAPLLESIIGTCSLMEEPLFTLVDELSLACKRVVLIFDSLMATTVQNIRHVANAEFYCFRSTSAFSLFSFFWEASGQPSLPEKADQIVRELPPTKGYVFNPEFQEFVLLQNRARNFHTGTIFNTSRIIEGLYVDLLEKSSMLAVDTHWAFGPFNPVDVPNRRDSRSCHRCLDWLNEQAPDSVLYVAFGSTSLLSDEQVMELAFGLERSGCKFLWILRDADNGDFSAGRKLGLPEGYENRVHESGLVVRDWAPQLEILAHTATGGFMSHCGWNSCMESITMGVPMATWPTQLEQQRNAVLMTKMLNIGVEVKDWAYHGKVVSRGTIADAVRRLVGSPEGDEIRQRAAELGSVMKRSVEKDGLTSLEMDSFIMHINRMQNNMERLASLENRLYDAAVTEDTAALREFLNSSPVLDAIMVVAILIATMAFQAAVNPPGGVWQDDLIQDSQGNPVLNPHRAGESVMAYVDEKAYKNFIRSNTVAFVLSLSNILLLISGLPFSRRLCAWILMVIMWLTVTSIAVAYGISVFVVSPMKDSKTVEKAMTIGIAVWCNLMGILLVGNTMWLVDRWLKYKGVRIWRPKRLIHFLKTGRDLDNENGGHGNV